MLVTLIRHGQIPANIDRRYTGRTDQPLTDTGKAQAAEADVPAVDRVFVSPLARCRETAAIMYPGMEQTVVDDLREMDFGIFENKTADEMADFAPYREWVAGMCEGPVPEGESLGDFSARCVKAFEEVVRGCGEGDHAAFVVHGGTIMAIMGAFNDEGRDYFEYRMENCQHITCECTLEPALVLHQVDGSAPEGALTPDEQEREALLFSRESKE